MALLYGNPNQITFTFDAIYTSIEEMNEDAANIMLGRFVLLSDTTKNLSYINMRTVNGYQQIGVVPKSSTEYSKIESIDLTIDAIPPESDRYEYTLMFNTKITVINHSWDGTGYIDTREEIYDSSPVMITFADSNEINFYTDQNNAIKLGLKTNAITVDKIKAASNTEDTKAWLSKFGITDLINTEYLEENYYNKNYIDKNFLTTKEANDNYILKNEAYGSLTFIGFATFNADYPNAADHLQVGIYDASNTLLNNIVVTSDTTYSNIPYGKYTIKRINHEDSEEYPVITVDVGYKSSETIDVADWASYNFQSNSWKRINYICSQNKAQQYWECGDTHSVSLNGKDYYLEIIGFNHDEFADSPYPYESFNHTANMTLQLGRSVDDSLPDFQEDGKLYIYEEALFTTQELLSQNGYYASIKTNYLENIAMQLVHDNNIALQSCYKETNKNGEISSQGENISLPSVTELFGNGNEGTIYPFYANNRRAQAKHMLNDQYNWNEYHSVGNLSYSHVFLLRSQLELDKVTIASLRKYGTTEDGFVTTNTTGQGFYIALNPIVYI